METEKSNSDLLVVIDGSYWLLYCIFGAFSSFSKSESPDVGRYSDPESVDQDNLPDILTSDDFRKELHTFVAKRIDTVNWVLKQNAQEAVDLAEKIDVLFVLDDTVNHSFRKTLYPAYKSQRKLVKKAYDVQKVKDYVVDILFKEFKLEEDYNWRIVKVDGAEGDDVVAVAVRNLKGYAKKIIIASDRDFLQLDDVVQYDLTGKAILPVIKDTGEEVSRSDYLLHKIIMGDKSDFIPSCFERYGEKKSWKLVKDRELLRNMLKENQSAAKQFILNRNLIDMNNIPEDLSEKILGEVKSALSTTKVLEKKADLTVADAIVIGSDDPMDL
jgi:5'-3' exonuclease